MQKIRRDFRQADSDYSEWAKQTHERRMKVKSQIKQKANKTWKEFCSVYEKRK